MTTVEDTVRTIVRCSVTKENHHIHIDIIGDGFLYNMVRIITGSLMDVGLGKTLPEEMAGIIEAKDRNLAKMTAPAGGLTLVGLTYDEGEAYEEDV